MFGFLKKNQRSEEPEKNGKDFNQFCAEHADALDYPDTPDLDRNNGISDKAVPDHIRELLSEKKSA